MTTCGSTCSGRRERPEASPRTRTTARSRTSRTAVAPPGGKRLVSQHSTTQMHTPSTVSSHAIGGDTARTAVSSARLEHDRNLLTCSAARKVLPHSGCGAALSFTSSSDLLLELTAILHTVLPMVRAVPVTARARMNAERIGLQAEVARHDGDRRPGPPARHRMGDCRAPWTSECGAVVMSSVVGTCRSRERVDVASSGVIALGAGCTRWPPPPGAGDDLRTALEEPASPGWFRPARLAGSCPDRDGGSSTAWCGASG